MAPRELKLGGLYFVLGYEDDNFTRPMVQSYEFMGVAPEGAQDAPYCFRLLGSDDRLDLAESQLDIVLDLRGLIQTLEEFALASEKSSR